MENAGYVTLSRQSDLMVELQVIANNIANQSTTGFRQEGVVFSEYVKRVDNGASLSMARGSARNTSMSQGPLTETGSELDFAIEGDGFFLVETPAGQRLTRAGTFSTNNEGLLVTYDGYQVLDAGAAPIFVPPNGQISVASDGTISDQGTPIGQIGLFQPVDPVQVTREDGVKFNSLGGVEPVDNGRLLQGFVEQSNVEPLGQIARMIEVQRAYEMGQKFLDSEDERIRNAVRNLNK